MSSGEKEELGLPRGGGTMTHAHQGGKEKLASLRCLGKTTKGVKDERRGQREEGNHPTPTHLGGAKMGVSLVSHSKEKTRGKRLKDQWGRNRRKRG